MSFTFLHAADFHLGSPFTGLSLRDETLAQRFAKASRDAFSNLVSRAIETQVSFVVMPEIFTMVNGKILRSDCFFNREMARLDRAGIHVFVLKGNHDAESVVTKAISLPKNVFQFATRPETVRIEELRAALHGRSFPTGL
jgi:DNA repair exonuclease SbcCD nuclease subunit